MAIYVTPTIQIPLTRQQTSDACAGLGGHLVDLEDVGEQEILSTIGNCKYTLLSVTNMEIGIVNKCLEYAP